MSRRESARDLDPGLQRSARLVGADAADARTATGHALWLATAPRSTLTEGRFWLDRRPCREHLVSWTHSRSAEPDRLGEWCMENGLRRPSSER